MKTAGKNIDLSRCDLLELSDLCNGYQGLTKDQLQLLNPELHRRLLEIGILMIIPGLKENMLAVRDSKKPDGDDDKLFSRAEELLLRYIRRDYSGMSPRQVYQENERLYGLLMKKGLLEKAISNLRQQPGDLIIKPDHFALNGHTIERDTCLGGLVTFYLQNPGKLFTMTEIGHHCGGDPGKIKEALELLDFGINGQHYFGVLVGENGTYKSGLIEESELEDIKHLIVDNGELIERKDNRYISPITLKISDIFRANPGQTFTIKQIKKLLMKERVLIKPKGSYHNYIQAALNILSRDHPYERIETSQGRKKGYGIREELPNQIQ